MLTATEAERRMCKALRAYGNYFTIGKQPGTQFSAAIPIVMIALTVLIWGLKKYLGAYLDELGTLHARESVEADDLRNEVDAVLADVAKTDGQVPQPDEFVGFLTESGLTATAANEAAKKIQITIVEVIEITRGN